MCVVSSKLYCVCPWGAVMCVAGMLGGGSVGRRRRSRDLGALGGEGLCQEGRERKMEKSTFLLTPRTWRQHRVLDLGTHISVSPGPSEMEAASLLFFRTWDSWASQC